LAAGRSPDRDYKNVREDVKALKWFGLIHRVKRSFRVPFDSILVSAEIRLAAPESTVLYAYFCRFSELGE
jgi:predicted transcriptional regulator